MAVQGGDLEPSELTIGVPVREADALFHR